MDADRQADLERRHRALIECDRAIGLEAEAEAARAEVARLQARLAVAQERLNRKNARIKELATRIAELQRPTPRENLRAWVARLAGRSHSVDEV